MSSKKMRLSRSLEIKITKLAKNQLQILIKVFVPGLENHERPDLEVNLVTTFQEMLGNWFYAGFVKKSMLVKRTRRQVIVNQFAVIKP